MHCLLYHPVATCHCLYIYLMELIDVMRMCNSTAKKYLSLTADTMMSGDEVDAAQAALAPTGMFPEPSHMKE